MADENTYTISKSFNRLGVHLSNQDPGDPVVYPLAHDPGAEIVEVAITFHGGSPDEGVYLPLDGSEAMIGTLPAPNGVTIGAISMADDAPWDLDGQEISNAGNYNGVTVEGHRLRHEVGGADEIIGLSVVSATEPVSKTTGKIWLDTASSGSIGGAVEIVTKTGAYTATVSDTVIICDATSAAFTVTLPTAATQQGKVFYIKKIDSSANEVTIDGSGAETIDDSTTKVLSAQYDAAMIVSDGTEWWIL